MTQIDIISNAWLDLLFEDRNKEYGAYLLRQQTGRRNFWAIVALLVLFVLAMLFIHFVGVNSKNNRNTVYDQVIEINTLRDAKPKVERPVVKPQDVENIINKVRNSIKFTTPEIVLDKDARPEDMLRSQEDMLNSHSAIGVLDVTGGSDDGVILTPHDIIAQPEPKPVVDDKVIDVAEHMPAYPGGNAELMKFLAENIKYPVICQETGTQGRVVCSFVVEKDGSVTDVRVVRSIDPNLDKEAVRVIKLMPHWIPGMQNGQHVRVRYTIPVVFRLQ